MATINITRSYTDTELLSAEDLDNIVNQTKTFLNNTKVSNDNIADEGINGSANFTIGSVSTNKIASSTIMTSLLADSPDGLAPAKINDSAVTTAKINDSAVTTAKINDSAVTYTKQSSCNRASADAGGSASLTLSDTIDAGGGNYYALVSGLSATITTNRANAKLVINIGPNGVGAFQLSHLGFAPFFYIYINDVPVYSWTGYNGRIKHYMFPYTTGATGAYNVKVRGLYIPAFSNDIIATNCKLDVIER